MQTQTDADAAFNPIQTGTISSFNFGRKGMHQHKLENNKILSLTLWETVKGDNINGIKFGFFFVEKIKFGFGNG